MTSIRTAHTRGIVLQIIQTLHSWYFAGSQNVPKKHEREGLSKQECGHQYAKNPLGACFCIFLQCYFLACINGALQVS